jgi:hypothetical protein
MYPNEEASPMHANRKYPWETWENGQVHRVCAADYGLAPPVLRCQIYRRARRDGLRATARIDGPVIEFQIASVTARRSSRSEVKHAGCRT